MTRLAAPLITAALLVSPLFAATQATAADRVVQRVTAADIGPTGPWIPLAGGDPARPAGVQEISPFADPVHFNGSLHLAVAGGAVAQQAQAAHYFTQLLPLSTAKAGPLSYDFYVRGATSTPSAIPVGANLQLPSFCHGTFTTLSFQPQLATDSQGRTGAVADAWRHFDASGNAVWRTSQTIGPFAAGSDHLLSEYAAECNGAADGAIGVIANVGRLGDASASLDTYVDNLTVNGTQYDFAVDGAATGSLDITPTGPGEPCKPGKWSTEGTPGRVGALPASTRGGGGGGGNGDSCSIEGTATFSSPADGPYFTDVGTRLVLSREGGLTPDDVTVTAYGQPVTVTAGPGGTLVATITPPTATDLAPGGTFVTPFTVTCDPDHAAGPVHVTAELLAQGFTPLSPTGVFARA